APKIMHMIQEVAGRHFAKLPTWAKARNPATGPAAALFDHFFQLTGLIKAATAEAEAKIDGQMPPLSERIARIPRFASAIDIIAMKCRNGVDKQLLFEFGTSPDVRDSGHGSRPAASLFRLKRRTPIGKRPEAALQEAARKVVAQRHAFPIRITVICPCRA
ncbi:MAG: hypothetical protein OXI87_04070, partial [Albidovulum sp.]|nr:hypothetical protein [Albidovulum sp.]